MDFIDPILSIAEKLYDLCEEVKANKKRCRRLASRVRTLTDLVKAVKNQGLGKDPEQVKKGLFELKLTLESAQEVVKKYTSSGYLKRIVKAYDLGEEFGSLNERLNDAAQLLSLALQVEQRQKMEEVFQEAIRIKQDEEDRKIDCDELQNLLQPLTDVSHQTKECVDAMHTTVQQTQKDIYDVKSMLESLNKPNLYLEDIKEIRSEELHYNRPPVLIMKSKSSEVFKGEYNKFPVAIKKYNCTGGNTADEIRKIFTKEVKTMKRFESPHILRMFGICVENEHSQNPTFLVVMEFCEKGSLRQLLDSPRKLSWAIKIRMCLDAAQGLYRLHQSEHKFKVHGCITSSKFLVAAGYRVKLGGFELAKTETSLKAERAVKCTSVFYFSPQLLGNVNHQYDKACEIYSFGIVLWEIATRQVPFKDCAKKEILVKVFKEKEKEKLPDDCPEQLKTIIDVCRSFEPLQRPTAGVLVDELRKLAQQYEED